MYVFIYMYVCCVYLLFIYEYTLTYVYLNVIWPLTDIKETVNINV